MSKAAVTSFCEAFIGHHLLDVLAVCFETWRWGRTSWLLLSETHFVKSCQLFVAVEAFKIGRVAPQISVMRPPATRRGGSRRMRPTSAKKIMVSSTVLNDFCSSSMPSGQLRDSCCGA
jgi:hypothetical protein